MINLIGCTKENFLKLLELMDYKRKKAENSKEEIFIYKPRLIKSNNRLKNNKKISKDNPFEKLSELRFR